MTSQRVERTWIHTGGYGRFRAEWVKNPGGLILQLEVNEVSSNNLEFKGAIPC